ncbi:VOC family protein [Mangrovihabitans endophyticus]|uniref:Lactoylglutathione lyase n=1 Tax=Mangrovihabitans endophyticus TaxID=1751298 RepID=A0A8J3FLK1_9ACTN|nr:VOC family protein [Mangrovihabitans endophyticus]GGK76689.1 lactoylglutathione lyase [Mangrovihabitans endophyticus]
MITINTVALYVTDQERSRRFYVDVLGFEVRADSDMGGMGRWLEVAPPGSPTAFVLADAAGFDRKDRVGSSADITLRSDDVHALHRDLTARGVTVTEPEKQDWGTFLTVTDPDGHRLLVRG